MKVSSLIYCPILGETKGKPFEQSYSDAYGLLKDFGGT
jgi:hypothetical protein